LKLLRAWGSFFIYSNLFIALCAVLMTHQVYSLLLNVPGNLHYIGFVFFSTLCSYSFHWYFSGETILLSDRTNWLQKFRYVHGLLFLIGFAGIVFYISYLLIYWPWLLAAAIATFLYSAPKIPNRYLRQLRKAALGKTIFLAAVWTYVTTLLPLIISGREWESSFTLFIISRYFLVYAICILFDYRDKEDDKAAGIRSLITLLSNRNIKYLFILSLGIFIASTLFLLTCDFSVLNIVLLVIPGIILAFLYRTATRHFTDMLYYFVLDGLMAFSALLTLIARI